MGRRKNKIYTYPSLNFINTKFKDDAEKKQLGAYMFRDKMYRRAVDAVQVIKLINFLKPNSKRFQLLKKQQFEKLIEYENILKDVHLKSSKLGMTIDKIGELIRKRMEKE